MLSHLRNAPAGAAHRSPASRGLGVAVAPLAGAHGLLSHLRNAPAGAAHRSPASRGLWTHPTDRADPSIHRVVGRASAWKPVTFRSFHSRSWTHPTDRADPSIHRVVGRASAWKPVTFRSFHSRSGSRVTSHGPVAACPKHHGQPVGIRSNPKPTDPASGSRVTSHGPVAACPKHHGQPVGIRSNPKPTDPVGVGFSDRLPDSGLRQPVQPSPATHSHSSAPTRQCRRRLQRSTP